MLIPACISFAKQWLLFIRWCACKSIPYWGDDTGLSSYAWRKKGKKGPTLRGKIFCVSRLDKSGMFAGLLIQFHIHPDVLLHLGSYSEIKQIPNVTDVSIHVFIYNTNYDQSTKIKANWIANNKYFLQAANVSLYELTNTICSSS